MLQCELMHLRWRDRLTLCWNDLLLQNCVWACTTMRHHENITGIRCLKRWRQRLRPWSVVYAHRAWRWCRSVTTAIVRHLLLLSDSSLNCSNLSRTCNRLRRVLRLLLPWLGRGLTKMGTTHWVWRWNSRHVWGRCRPLLRLHPGNVLAWRVQYTAHRRDRHRVWRLRDHHVSHWPRRKSHQVGLLLHHCCHVCSCELVVCRLWRELDVVVLLRRRSSWHLRENGLASGCEDVIWRLNLDRIDWSRARICVGTIPLLLLVHLLLLLLRRLLKCLLGNRDRLIGLKSPIRRDLRPSTVHWSSHWRWNNLIVLVLRLDTGRTDLGHQVWRHWISGIRNRDGGCRRCHRPGGRGRNRWSSLTDGDHLTCVRCTNWNKGFSVGIENKFFRIRIQGRLFDVRRWWRLSSYQWSRRWHERRCGRFRGSNLLRQNCCLSRLRFWLLPLDGIGRGNIRLCRLLWLQLLLLMLRWRNWVSLFGDGQRWRSPLSFGQNWRSNWQLLSLWSMKLLRLLMVAEFRTGLILLYADDRRRWQIEFVSEIFQFWYLISAVSIRSCTCLTTSAPLHRLLLLVMRLVLVASVVFTATYKEPFN